MLKTRQTKTRKAPPRKKTAPARMKKAAFAAAPASPFDLKSFCGTYQLSPDAVSRITGAALRTVAYWAAGKEPQRSSQQKIREMIRLFDALADQIDRKAIGAWLHRPNPAFEGSTPLQVIERGEGDRLWRMIWELREGNSG
jgi:hypothetical protein